MSYSVPLIDTILDSGGTDTVVSGPFWMGPDKWKNLYLQASWNQNGSTSQDLDGTTTHVTIEASNDPRARPHSKQQADAEWIDITSEVTGAGSLDPDGSAGGDDLSIANAGYECYRFTVVADSGDGDYKLWARGEEG